jgi:hypothetical protein
LAVVILAAVPTDDGSPVRKAAGMTAAVRNEDWYDEGSDEDGLTAAEYG